MPGDVADDIIAEMKTIPEQFALKDGYTQGIVRLFYFRRQSPFETGEQTVFNAGDIFWRTVAGQYQLLAILV